MIKYHEKKSKLPTSLFIINVTIVIFFDVFGKYYVMCSTFTFNYKAIVIEFAVATCI